MTKTMIPHACLPGYFGHSGQTVFLPFFFQSMSIGDKKNIQQAVFVASFFLIYLCLKFASFLSCISMQDLDLFKVKL